MAEKDARLRVASEIMTSPVVAVKPDMLVHEAALALLRRGFSGAPVVDEAHHVVGMVSEADLVRSLAAAAFAETPVDPIETVMSRDVVTADPDADLFELASQFARAGVRRLPVVSEGALVGLITRRDVLRALARVCDERCAEDVPSTMDAIAKLELVHNPFPSQRHRPPR